MPPPHATSSCVHAAPSVEANALRSRHAPAVAIVRTMRWSPRSAASAANSSASLSSRLTAKGSIAKADAQCPRAGSTGASGVAGPAGWASAIASARPSAASAPAAERSRVAAKPQPPPTRTRTPMPSAIDEEMSSTWPLRTASSSVSVATWRASA